MSEQEVVSHAEPKHSGIGIASFAISIVAGILIVVTFVIAGMIEMSTPGGMDEESAEAMMIGFAIMGLFAADVLAFGLGVGAMFQTGVKKLFAILGMVFSFVIVGFAGVLILVGLAYE